MKILTNKLLIEIIGVTSIVVSLLFVGYELRLSRSVAESEGYDATAERNRELGNLIASNADIWARGCMAEELSSSDRVVFTNIALTIMHNQFTSWGRSNIGISTLQTDVPPRALANSFYHFPGLYAIWGEEGRYSPEFRAIVNEEYDKLLRKGSEKNIDVAWCGRL